MNLAPAYRQEAGESELEDTRQSEWLCKECEHPYDKAAIEHRLVQRVQERTLAFQLQDLVCSKCGEMKADQTSQYCT